MLQLIRLLGAQPLVRVRPCRADEAARREALREAQHAGLSGIAVVSPNHTAFYDAPDERDDTETAAGVGDDAH